MSAYYNEIDPYCAQWLRNLVAAGLIPAGDVDERPIEEVTGDDVRPYTQAHFFAGIGGWAYAARLAGWPDDRPIWTGSCPCQPFSNAGKRLAYDDPRNLWPYFARLIADCRPPVVAGEQVASKAGRLWLAGIRADLEALGYGVGAADISAAGVGAPHIRQRLWWVADQGLDDAAASRRNRPQSDAEETPRDETRMRVPDSGCEGGGLADADGGHASAERQQRGREHGQQPENSVAGGDGRLAESNQQRVEQERADAGWRGKGSEAERMGERPGRLRPRSGLADNDRAGCQEQRGGGLLDGERQTQRDDPDGCGEVCWGNAPKRLPNSNVGGSSRPRRMVRSSDPEAGEDREVDRTDDAGGGPWGNAIWLPCADGKSRRIEPGIEPLVAGVSVHLERMRSIEDSGLREIESYGNQTKTDADEVLRMVRDFIQPKKGGETESSGMFQQLHAPQILLDFLLCIEAARDGAADRIGFQKESNETRRRIVRGVWVHGKPGSPPHQQRPDGQSDGESADPLLALSLVLARHAEAHQEAARNAHAASGRTGMLRAYGNAIVPQVAAAIMECME